MMAVPMQAPGWNAAAARFRDPRFQAVAVKVNPGEHYVTQSAEEMIVTVLGSCVAVCIRDSVAGVGGMNHFMLPESATGTWGAASASLRYGNFAMERLVNDILCRGGRRTRLEVKVFGGASMIGGGASIGLQNADFVESYLRDEGLPIAAQHLRGDHARRVNYFPLTGRVFLLEMRREDIGIAADEAGYQARLRAEPVGGSVELFD